MLMVVAGPNRPEGLENAEALIDVVAAGVAGVGPCLWRLWS